MKFEKYSNNTERVISLKAIEDWRKHVSLNDLPASAKTLYTTLLDCNKAKLSYDERYKILALLSPLLSCITQALKKNYDEKEVLTQSERIIADLVNVLNIEMLNGYKLVIQSACKRFFYDKKIVISSFQRALTICTRILFSAYEQHRASIPGVWLEFHQLYKLAKKKWLLNKSLKKYSDVACRLDSLEDIYKHYLLFAICHPHRMMKKQITLLCYTSETWAPYLILTKSNKKNNHLFMVDMSQDFGPKHAGLTQNKNPDCYYLNVEKVIRRLTILLEALRSKEDPARLSLNASEMSLSESMIEILLLSWKSITERAQQRTKAQGMVEVCLGLAACVKVISNNEVLCPEVLLDVSDENESIDLGNIPLPEHQTSTEIISKQIIYHGELIDESIGGYCLKWQGEVPPQLQCGEIIGIRSENGEENWTIGNIRWLKTEDDQTVMIGIQILSTYAAPVSARFIDATSQQGIATLLLPEIEENDKPMTLVTPSLPFKSGQEIELEYLGQVYPVMLQKSYSQSTLYQEFALEFLHNTINLSPSDQLPPTISVSQ